MSKTMFALASAAVVASAAQVDPQNEGRRLIAFNETTSQWMTEKEIMGLAHKESDQGVGFMDITDAKDFSHIKLAKRENAIPTTPRAQAVVRDVIDNHLCQQGDCAADVFTMADYLADRENYLNRYYTTQASRDSVMWLDGMYKRAAGARLSDDVSISVVEHTWEQPSLIVRMTGTTNPSEVVVIGGHIDSIAGGASSRAPGFDDDATGSATVYATFKALVNAGYRPERTLEFHAYAAEEVGLRGSQAVAQDYRARAIDVVTMCQFDMTCYSPNKQVGLTRDFTDPTLTAFLSQLLDEYTGIEGAVSTCGYGCSDHASFTAQGYPAAFPFEAPFGLNNPFIHTTADTADKCDREYMGEMAKLAVAYSVEMSTL